MSLGITPYNDCSCSFNTCDCATFFVHYVAKKLCSIILLRMLLSQVADADEMLSMSCDVRICVCRQSIIHYDLVTMHNKYTKLLESPR